MNMLTSPGTIDILYLLPNCSNRNWRSEYKRHSRIHAVFLCLKHSFPLLWWAERSGRKAGRSLYRYANFVQSATHDWRHRLGGLFNKSSTSMKNHSPNPANSGQVTVTKLQSEQERIAGFLKVLNASALLCQSKPLNQSDFQDLHRYLGYLIEDCDCLKEAAKQLREVVAEGCQ